MNATKRGAANEVLTVAEASAVKGISEDGIRVAIRDGRLPATRKGNMWFIRRADLDAWRSRRSKKTADAD